MRNAIKSAALALLLGCHTGASNAATPPPSGGPSPDAACVVRDSDHDRIADVCDLCPNGGETYNGLDDDDGCPDNVDWMPGPPVLRIRFAVGITFERSSSQLGKRGAVALHAVADWLRAHPENERIACVGNAEPTEANATRLALERAQRVTSALVSEGIALERLNAHGSSVGAHPAAPSQLDPAHPAQGRNVTLHVVREAGVELERWNGSRLEPVAAMPAHNHGSLILAGLPAPGCIGLDFVPAAKGCPNGQ